MKKTDKQANASTPESSVKQSKNRLKTKAFTGTGALVLATAALIGGSLVVGYSVGHQQGLTVVGFDADAEELAAIVEKQKLSIDTLGASLNTATQERDIAVKNAKELNGTLTQVREDQAQTAALNTTYREKLRERGGLSLTIQNIAIKPLPSNAYEYVLDLIQVSPNKRRAMGSFEIRLIGQEDILVVPLENTV